MRNTPVWFLGALIFAGAASASLALNTPSSVQAEEEHPVRLAITESDIRIEDFLIAVSRVLEQNIVFNPDHDVIHGKTIRGGVDLQAQPGRMLRMVRALLLTHGIALQRVGPVDSSTWAVVAIDRASASDNLTPEFIQVREEDAEALAHDDARYVTTTMHVEHLQDLRATSAALTRLLSHYGRGSVSAVPEARAFVVTDFAPHVLNIYRTLQRLDVPGPGNTTTAGTTIAIVLEHTPAEDVARVLAQHFAAAAPQEASPPPQGPRIVAHRASNQVLVTGTEAAVQRVRKAAALLDVPRRAAEEKAR